MKNDSNTITPKIPQIKRARDYHVYDSRGKRYWDFYLNSGRALLGHRPKGFSEEIKNTLSRGIWSEYPSPFEKKTEKAAKRLFPEFPHIRFFRNYERAEKALLPGPPADPAFDEAGKACLWRPFLETPAEAEILLPLIPVPGAFEGVVAVSREDPEAESDLLSPLVHTALTHMLHSLERSLESADRGHWPLFDALPEFRRKGPYLVPQLIGEEYSLLFQEALDFGILLPPNPETPAIIPGFLCPGEDKLLKSFTRRKG